MSLSSYVNTIGNSGGTFTNINVTNTCTTSNLKVLGTQTTVNAITTVASNLTINNTSGGYGAALSVSQAGLGTNYPVAEFYDTSTSTTIPSLMVASGGLVGIGTTNPIAKLDVAGGSFHCAGVPVQIVYARTTAYTALSTVNTWTNLNFSGTITPKYANSLLLVEFNASLLCTPSAIPGPVGIALQIYRDGVPDSYASTNGANQLFFNSSCGQIYATVPVSSVFPANSTAATTFSLWGQNQGWGQLTNTGLNNGGWSVSFLKITEIAQ